MNTLKKWMLVNTIFSVSSGIIMLAFNNWLQTILGFDNTLILLVIGINLLIFGAFILWVRKTHLKDYKWVYLISILDLFWVIGSLLLLIFRPFNLTETAYWIIGIIAFIVGYIGIQQYRYSSTGKFI